MKQLIAINTQKINSEIVQTIRARDLHAFLEIRTRFNDWIKSRIKDFSFIENEDFITLTENLVNGGQSKEYHLTFDMAKELSMVERNVKGKQARQYFIECERKIKEQQKLQIDLNNPEQLHNLLLDYTMRTKILQTKIEEQRPKVEFFEAIARSSDGQTIAEIGKILGLGVKKFFQILRSRGLLRNDNLPFQRYLEAKYFKVIEKKYKNKEGTTKLYRQTLITGKGLTYLQNKLAG